MKKVVLSCLKMKLKISHKLRIKITWYICKGISKIKNWFVIGSDSWTGKITILNPPIRYKEGWCVRLGQEGGFVRVGGTVWNTLKGGGTEKRGKETKDFKKERSAGLRSGCLKKKVGLEPPYEIYIIPLHKVFGKVLRETTMMLYNNLILEYRVDLTYNFTRLKTSKGRV